ncbi:MAG: oligosaccharide flippase family protein [Ferruginibacter sp.]
MAVNKRTISVNIFFSLLQIIVIGIVYYFLYKFLLTRLGAEIMGVWAIVLSISSTANIANLGIANSVIRYTSKYLVNNEIQKINRIIHTSFILLSCVFIIILCIVFLIAPWWLRGVISGQYYPIAISLVPYSLICLILNATSSIFVSGIDGLQKNYIKSVLVIISTLLLLFFSFLFVPKFGLIGVAYAQLIQASVLWLSSLAALKIIFRPLQVFRLKWDKEEFKNIFSFGIKEQIISICQLGFDPLTKSLLGVYGSLNQVTYYEMANRLITQLRSILVSINQVFIPVYTAASELVENGERKIFGEVFKINFILSLLWLSFIISTIIPVSIIWIGSVNNDFVFITIALAVAYFCNIFITPQYFANIANARLNNNVISNVIITLLNILLCYLLGSFLGGYGVVAGWGIALAIGSLYVVLAPSTYKIGIKEIVRGNDRLVVILCIIFCSGCFVFLLNNEGINVWLMFLFASFILGVLFLLINKIHPFGRKILNLVKSKNAVKIPEYE